MSLNVPSILFTFTIVGSRAGADPKVQLRIEPKDLSAIRLQMQLKIQSRLQPKKLSAPAPAAAKNSEPAPAKGAVGSGSSCS